MLDGAGENSHHLGFSGRTSLRVDQPSIFMTSWELAAEFEKRLVHRSLERTENNREAKFLMYMLEQL